jgi:hypothetical protein
VLPFESAKPPGTAADPLAPTASDVLLESNVPSELEQLLVVQTSNVTFPVSCVSASLKVAVSVGVVVLSCTASAGETRAGVDGEAFDVLFVMDALLSVAVLDAFPVVSAVSRTIGFAPGFV